MTELGLETGPVVGPCEHGNEFCNFIRVAERLLASKEGLISLELFSAVFTSKRTTHLCLRRSSSLLYLGKLVYFENDVKRNKCTEHGQNGALCNFKACSAQVAVFVWNNV